MKRIDLLPKLKEVGINSKALYSDLMDYVLSSEKGDDNINCESLKVTLQKVNMKVLFMKLWVLNHSR